MTDAKKRLLILSKNAKNTTSYNTGNATVNEIIISWYTESILEENKDLKASDIEFKTFAGWKKEGKKVKKGEKGYIVWSKPRKYKKKVESEETATGKTKTEEFDFEFFGTAYLFSNLQVK